MSIRNMESISAIISRNEGGYAIHLLDPSSPPSSTAGTTTVELSYFTEGAANVLFSIAVAAFYYPNPHEAAGHGASAEGGHEAAGEAAGEAAAHVARYLGLS